MDAGAGEMRYRKYCEHLNYTSQDFAQYTGDESLDGLSVGDHWDASKVDIISDIINMPVEDDSFDNVLCTEVFEHLSQPELAMKEFSRVLKSGGHLYITFPMCCLNHMAPYFYSSGYSEYMFRFWCEKYGFEVEELTPNGNYILQLRQELARLPMICHNHGKDVGIFRHLQILSLEKFLNRINTKLSDTSSYSNFGYMCVARKR